MVGCCGIQRFEIFQIFGKMKITLLCLLIIEFSGHVLKHLSNNLSKEPMNILIDIVINILINILIDIFKIDAFKILKMVSFCFTTSPLNK